jgi:hypothetical protein
MRVGFAIYFFQAFHVHMGIALGSTYAGVAEQFLYYPYITA